MTDPLTLIGRHTIRPGKLDAAKQASRELCNFLQANHPRVLQFEIYINESAGEMTVMQVHPDEESLMLHLELAGDRIAQAYEFLERTVCIDLYGSPSDAVVQQTTRQAMGAPVRFHAAHAGFSRLDRVSP